MYKGDMFYALIHGEEPVTILNLLNKGYTARKEFIYDAAALGFFDNVPCSDNEEVSNVNSLDLIKPLITAGADLNFSDDEGRTVLFLAVYQENLPLLKRIIQLGVSVNCFDKEGSPLIHASLNCRDTRFLRTLLENGGDVNALDKNNHNLLFKAVENLCPDSVRLVLKFSNHVDKDSADKCFSFLFHFGCDDSKYYSHYVTECVRKIIDELLDFGLDIPIEDINSNCLSYAINLKSIKLVEYLLNGGVHPNSYLKQNCSVLQYAIESNRIEIVRLLLNCGAQISGDVILTALQLQDMQFIKCLLDWGVGYPVDYVLYLAITGGSDESVEFMLNCGKNLDLISIPFLYIAMEREPHIFQLLIDHGIPVDKTNHFGNTPLHTAVELNKSELVRILLDSGADVSLRNLENKTALQYWGFNFEHPDRIDSSKIMIMKHIIQLKMLNQYVDPEDLAISESIITLIDNRFICYCRMELELLSSTKPLPHGLTYLELFTMSSTRLSIYLKNQNLVDVLSAFDFVNHYPFFGYLLSLNFKKGLRVVTLMRQGAEVLSEILMKFIHFPFELIEKILCYFNEDELSLLSLNKDVIKM